MTGKLDSDSMFRVNYKCFLKKEATTGKKLRLNLKDYRLLERDQP